MYWFLTLFRFCFALCCECALCWEYKSGKAMPKKTLWRHIASEIPLPRVGTSYLEKQPGPSSECPSKAELEKTSWPVACSWSPLALSEPCWCISHCSWSCTMCIRTSLVGHLSPNTQCSFDGSRPSLVWPVLQECHCSALHSAMALSLVKVYLKCACHNIFTDPFSNNVLVPFLCCHSNESIPGTSYTYTRSPSIVRVSEHKHSPSSIAGCPGWTRMAIQEQEKGHWLPCL